MAMEVTRKKAFQANYAINDVYQAVESAVEQFPNFRLVLADPEAFVYRFKTKVSRNSWGETVEIVLSSLKNGATKISIASTPKTGMFFGGLADAGKNNENIYLLSQAIAKELKKYTPLPELSQS